ncbi:carotenoid oxygenase family protein [Streptomyces venezuelae]|uniref:carotenoid oxygenase family protein n=1 Tax=Streptomyces venezuelae TaxID=54571 RepID=UPI0037D15E67
MTKPAPPRLDPTRVPHLLGTFAPVTEEVDIAELEVTGEIPAWLDGLYLRNGPNPRFTPIGSYLYPIDGDGMLHGVWLSEGRARYRNRFVPAARRVRRGALVRHGERSDDRLAGREPVRGRAGLRTGAGQRRRGARLLAG